MLVALSEEDTQRAAWTGHLRMDGCAKGLSPGPGPQLACRLCSSRCLGILLYLPES